MHDIVIIGGGIGGLTTAIALRRRGIVATVYEAAAELRPVGAGILVPPNALQVLAQLGLAGAVCRAGVTAASGAIRDYSGALLQQLDNAALARRYGYAAVAIHRARLHALLADALDPAQLQLGKSCSRIIEEPGAIRVCFEDGSEVRTRVLIGADGLRSVVRGQLFPEATLRYSGQSSYRGIATGALPAGFEGVGEEIWGPGLRFGFAPIGAGEIYWFATIDAAPGTAAAGPGVKELLQRQFAAFPTPVGALIAATPEAKIINTDMYDLRPLATWHRGNIGLLGDAAHATTPNLGQGGAQAIEDAYVLADCLVAQHDSSVALANYAGRRRTRATMIVNRSWQLGKVAHLRNPLARTARNILLRLTPEAALTRQTDTLYNFPTLTAPAVSGMVI